MTIKMGHSNGKVLSLGAESHPKDHTTIRARLHLPIIVLESHKVSKSYSSILDLTFCGSAVGLLAKESDVACSLRVGGRHLSVNFTIKL